jgi:large subunit ribosomal protein L30
MANRTAQASNVSMLKVTQVRGAIGCTRRQRESLKGLGLRRIGASVVVQDNPASRGLIRTVAHLVTVEG